MANTTITPNTGTLTFSGAVPTMAPTYGKLTANGATSWITLPEGEAFVFLTGTFGSGTVVVQMQLVDGLTAQAVSGLSWTAATATAINLRGGAKVRLNLSGATGPSITWEVRPKRVRVNNQLLLAI